MWLGGRLVAVGIGSDVKSTLEMIAGRVVIRHTCHCATAVERTDGDVEHVFAVDGEDFPWLISDSGPTVSRVADDLYIVAVELLLIVAPPDYRVLDFAYTCEPESYVGGRCSVPFVPVIDGVEFPWLLTDDGCRLKFGHKMLPELTVAFFAHHVDANIPVVDVRGDVDEVFSNGGCLIYASV